MLKKILTAGAVAVTLLGAATPSFAQMPKSTLPPAKAASWRIDANHSELTFRVRHLVSKVRGQFNQ